MKLRSTFKRLILGGILLFFTNCVPPQTTHTPFPEPLPDEIVLYNWVKDMPERVLEAFTQEYGVKVHYETYESQEEAIENIQAGKVYDVVVMDNRFIPGLIQENLLAGLNLDHLSNLSNIASTFLDRSFDPGNQYSVPYNWGTTGLVYRSDLIKQPVTSWNDLWNQQAVGKVILWRGLSREMIGAALKSLGYSANSESPEELQQALARLIELRPNLIFVEDYGPELETSSPILNVGNGVMAIGWAYDVLEGRKENGAISYVLPTEGALLWGDNLVIPANSSKKYAAELFLNYILRPEISALITNDNGYPTGNEKANPYIKTELRDNAVVFPPIEDVRRAELILPLSQEGEQLHQEIWDQFLASFPSASE